VATLMVLGGFAGLIGGTAVAASGGDEGLDFLAILGGWGFVAAGFVMGGWLGLALVSLRRHGVACPRCGTWNDSTAIRCEACHLPLR